MPTVNIAEGELYYETRGSGSDVLVWLHAFGCSLREWDDVIPRLDGYTSIAIDMPGFGQSAAAGKGCHIPDLAASVIGALDQLGVRRFTCVGHSMGGGVALRLAIDHPERVQAVVGVASLPAHGTPRRPDSEAMVEGFAGAYGNRADLDAGVHQLTTYDIEHWNNQMVEDMLRVREDAWMDWLRAGNTFWSQEDELAAVSVSCCYLIPGNDLVLPPEDQLRTARDIPGGRAVILNGYGHLLPGENPALVAYEIGSWLNHVRTSVAHA